MELENNELCMSQLLFCHFFAHRDFFVVVVKNDLCRIFYRKCVKICRVMY